MGQAHVGGTGCGQSGPFGLRRSVANSNARTCAAGGAHVQRAATLLPHDEALTWVREFERPSAFLTSAVDEWPRVDHGLQAQA